MGDNFINQNMRSKINRLNKEDNNNRMKPINLEYKDPNSNPLTIPEKVILIIGKL